MPGKRPKQKIIALAHCKELILICYRFARAACGIKPARSAGLFLLRFNNTYAGGPGFIKHHQGVRFAAAPVVFSAIVLSPPARRRNRKDHKV